MPGTECRPTQDKVRSALYSMIGPRIEGARFLDLFACSGAVGLDALSRGAAQVCWVESDRRALLVLKENVERIYGRYKTQPGCAELRFGGGDALSFLEKTLETGPFDIIFADPPYDRDGRKAWLAKMLDILAAGKLLAEGGLFIMEQSTDEELVSRDAWALVKNKAYGSTAVRFFMRKESAGVPT